MNLLLGFYESVRESFTTDERKRKTVKRIG